jgi:hypothetical protein
MLLKPSSARLLLTTTSRLTLSTTAPTATLARRTLVASHRTMTSTAAMSSAAGMTSNQGARLDLAKEIKIDHDNVRDLLARYQAADEPELKKALASTLIREMAVHGDAEVRRSISLLSLPPPSSSADPPSPPLLSPYVGGQRLRGLPQA